jgi:hypothetical protein
LVIDHGRFSIVAEADIPGGFAAVVEASTVGLPFAAAVVLGQYLGGRAVGTGIAVTSASTVGP